MFRVPTWLIQQMDYFVHKKLARVEKQNTHAEFLKVPRESGRQ